MGEDRGRRHAGLGRTRIALVAGLGLALVLAPGVLASGATVTRGDFSAFATGGALIVYSVRCRTFRYRAWT